MRAVDAVVSGAVENAYALVRPPGHHAEPDRGRGYCIFGNIAVAIMYARARLGVTRVAVVDWDVHHGNGTQRAFYEAPNVLTISIHQDNLYPANSGAVSENGAGSGLGYNLNIPMPPGSGGGAYLAAFERLIVPALRRFKPELIMVASGLDAGGFDPLGCMMLHSEHYRRLTRLILEVSCISPHTGHGDPRSQGLVRSNDRNGSRCHRRGDREPTTRSNPADESRSCRLSITGTETIWSTKSSFSFHKSPEELNRSAWTHANRVRRSVSGEIGGSEFEIVPSGGGRRRACRSKN